MRTHSSKTPIQPLEKRASLRLFLRTLAEHSSFELDKAAEGQEELSWKAISCLACANCCRQMSPRYTAGDLRRIAHHFRMSIKTFKEKWLLPDAEGNWMNRTSPCPFLDVCTNRCTIYAVRPADCAQFPHLSARPLERFLPTHQQNIRFCPATETFVEAIFRKLDDA